MMILSDYKKMLRILKFARKLLHVALIFLYRKCKIFKKIITCIFDNFVQEMGRTYLFVDGFSKILKHIEGQTEHWILQINICVKLSYMENTELQNTVIRLSETDTFICLSGFAVSP